jgi:hypothetical protein
METQIRAAEFPSKQPTCMSRAKVRVVLYKTVEPVVRAAHLQSELFCQAKNTVKGQRRVLTVARKSITVFFLPASQEALF